MRVAPFSAQLLFTLQNPGRMSPPWRRLPKSPHTPTQTRFFSVAALVTLYLPPPEQRCRWRFTESTHTGMSKFLNWTSCPRSPIPGRRRRWHTAATVRDNRGPDTNRKEAAVGGRTEMQGKCGSPEIMFKKPKRCMIMRQSFLLALLQLVTSIGYEKYRISNGRVA